jgi:hypothetical protein
MFILGMLAVIQITFLPGVLIYKAFKLQKGIISSIVFSFGLSLIANYIGVFLLAALGLYTSTSMYIIFSLEIILAVWLYRDSFSQSLGNMGTNFINSITSYFLSLEIKNPKDDPKQAFVQIVVGGIYAFFIIMAFSSLWWILKFWWNSLGSVFSMWDPVVQWNGWALQWFQNKIPLNTHLYPQLMPVSFSIPYVFMGSSQLQLFTTGFMPLFTVFILFIMFDLGVRERKIGYFIGLVITRYIIKKFYFLHISEGYVDLPLAFFSLISVYCLLLAENEQREDVLKRTLWLGAIFTAGASMTKQSGLYLFALYPILIYFIVLKKNKDFEIKEKLKIALIPSLILLIIVLPGYAFAQINILTGLNKSNAWGVFEKHYNELNLLERIPGAIESLDKYVYLYPLLVLLIPLLSKTHRWIALTIVFPYTLIWSMLFSYSVRNLSLAIPFLGLGVGMGLGRVLILSKQIFTRFHLHRIKAAIIPIILALVVFGLSFHFTDAELVNQQTEEQTDILFQSINKKLYAFFPEGGPYEKIITQYPIRYLPGFEDSQIRYRFETYEGYVSKKEEHPDVKLLLIEKSANEQVLEEVFGNIDKGNYKLIFDDQGYIFVQILTEE